MNLYFAPHLTGLIPNEEVLLNEEESIHCIRVCRMHTGDKIMLTNGQGGLFEGEIITENPKKCQVRLILAKQEIGKKNYHLHLAIAPTKSADRFEWFLEKATEIGISEITPLLCEHSERIKLRTDRLQKVLVAAMKQSLNLYLPKLNIPETFNDFISHQSESQKFIAYVEEKQEMHLKSLYTRGNDCIVLIGPEGDFSREEVKLAIARGYKTVSLGDSRLRTETAGVVATHAIVLMNT